MNLMEQLKIVIVGHVDHGKSTFIGRLMHDTGSLPEGRLEQLQQASARRGTPFEWANLMDALQAERDQNVTIDTAQIWFKTRNRQYVIIDAPGHKEFLKNMVTGAAGAHAALLVIDALEGIQENTRRHGYLLSLLGISQVAVLVNKMDLANYSQQKFERIETEFRQWLSNVRVLPKLFIPIAAKHGENVAARSPNMPWWEGPTAVEALDEFEVPGWRDDKPLRFPIQDVYRFDERRILAGRIEAGAIKVGDRIVFSPSNKVSTVKTIERWNAPQTGAAEAGESIGITLTEQIFIERGTIGAPETSPPYELTKFKARVFWLGKRPFAKGRKYKLKLATQEVECEIDSIERVTDAATLAAVSRGPDGNFVGRHEVGELTIRTRKPVAFDAITEIVPTGRFVIVDDLDVSGGGVILDNDYPRHTHDAHRKSSDVYWSRGKVTAAQRELRNGHSGCVIWFTGLSGSGKSTIAVELERELFNLGRQTRILDGDNIRHGLCSDLGFSPKERTENIRRVGEVARLFADTGIICITAFISPYRADRDLARAIAPPGRFIEVFLNAPLEVCEQRDSKGLYARARAGELKQFTGISAPYEAPLKPEIELHTNALSVGECVTIILERLKKLLPASP
ncbi:MAG TPA: adenylyl-sulfate kinase [Verrucomicrobiae bacterium]|nr:adenylyl-sulfate kinase [Verrucomicrobiae bacterium]